MKVSVVVPNHGRDISILKWSILDSTYKNVEFIEVNRGFERSKQRNIGIDESKGEVILWLDSDQSVSKGLIKEAVELMNTGVTALYVPEVIIATSFFGRIRAFERSFLTGTAVDVPRFVLKRICPRFDEKLNGPEDACFGQRIKGIRTTTRNVLYHHDDIGFWEYCKKKAYYSKSMKEYERKYPSDPCINLFYRCWTVFTENGKWKRFFSSPRFAICVFALLLIRGIIYVRNKG